MDCVASVYRANGKRMYNICMVSATQKAGTTTGYYSTENSNEVLAAIKKQIVLNYVPHKVERTSHLLFQPCEPNKNILHYFLSSQYCIGVAKGLRDRTDPKNFFNDETKYIDASARSISSGKPILTLVQEMNLSHALNAKQVISILKCVINKANIKIEDILVFNLTTGDFWCVTSI